MNGVAIFSVALILSAAIWFGIEKMRRRTHPVAGGLKRDVVLPHTQSFELYGNAFSHCSRKTRLVLAELGIPYRHIPVDLIETGSYGTLEPRFLRVNPAGLIPVLVHNGHPVHESDDILAYAVGVVGTHELVPVEPDLREDMMRWIAFCNLSSSDPAGGKAQSLGACIPGLTLPLFATMIRYVPIHRIATGLLFHYDKKRPLFFLMAKLLGARRIVAFAPIATMIASSRKAMGMHLRKVEQVLAHDMPWLLGEQFTLADITLGCALLRLEETGALARFARDENLGATLAYFARLKERPSWAAAIEDVRHPLVGKGVADLNALHRQMEKDLRASP